MNKRSDSGIYNPAKDSATKPWFLASIAVTLFLIALLAGHLVFSLHMTSSFTNRELSIERASWKLLLHAETMKMATRVSTLSGNLKWRKTYDRAQTELKELLQDIPDLIASETIRDMAGEIQSYRHNISGIEARAYDLVGRGQKEQALRLLAGWEYTKNKLKFERAAEELVSRMQQRMQRKIYLQKLQTWIVGSLVLLCVFALLLSWSVTIKLWRDQLRNKKQAEQDLRQSEEKYRKLFDTSPDAVALVDEDGRFLTVNPVMAERFGMSREEIDGKTLHAVMAAEVADRRMKMGREALEKQAPVFFEDSRQGRDFHNYYVPVFSFGGKKTFQIISKDITGQKQMEQKLREMGLYDPTTMLYSRSFYAEEIKRLSDPRYCPIGIIVCDLDGLKLVNDTMGHSAGDVLLKKAAEILRLCFRTSDVVARIGGDEFAVLLPETDRETTAACCKRIRKELARYNEKAPPARLSMSIGRAVCLQPPVDLDALFKEADSAMYRDKHQKRDGGGGTFFSAGCRPAGDTVAAEK
ncbi:MAG: diguanylate cyclase [Desulfosalsimonadaceae bacterium]